MQNGKIAKYEQIELLFSTVLGILFMQLACDQMLPHKIIHILFPPYHMRSSISCIALWDVAKPH